jgi:hypothetical protein
LLFGVVIAKIVVIMAKEILSEQPKLSNSEMYKSVSGLVKKTKEIFKKNPKFQTLFTNSKSDCPWESGGLEKKNYSFKITYNGVFSHGETIIMEAIERGDDNLYRMQMLSLSMHGEKAEGLDRVRCIRWKPMSEKGYKKNLIDFKNLTIERKRKLKKYLKGDEESKEIDAENTQVAVISAESFLTKLAGHI